MVRLLALIVLLAALPHVGAGESLLKNRTVSSSGAFVVYSPDAVLRGRMAREAEEVLGAWKKTVDATVAASAPIVIQDRSGDVRPKGMPDAKIIVFEVEGGGTKVQLDIWEKSAASGDALASEVFRALALHAMYRAMPPRPGAAVAPPPQWLVEGLTETLRGREGEVPSGVHAALLRSDRPPSLRRFLKERPEIMDSRSLLLYRAQAYALLEVLRSVPDSRRRMAEFLVAISQGGIKGLSEAFPGVGGDESGLTKRWTLAIAKTSMPQRHSSLGVRASSDALDRLLAVVVPVDPEQPDASAPGGALALPGVAKTREGPRLMRERALECVALEFRAHPLMKPVIAEYRRIFMTLERKPKAKVEAEIAELERIRTILLQRHTAILDYLNWYEATRLDGGGESMLDRMPAQPDIPPRTDPVTRTLDEFEALGW